MRWQDKAIILGARPFGESSLIVEVMSESHGRHLGVVKGGKSRRASAVLQAGNHVTVEWWARLDEHLGSFRVEVINYSAAQLMQSSSALYALELAAVHLRLLPERDPHKRLFDITKLLISHVETPLILAELLVRLELYLLEELGFGLDLSRCAVTGKTDNLIYVSPKSARAVSREPGEPWKDKLMVLPQFLLSNASRPQDLDSVISGFKLTGYFLDQYVWKPRAITPPSVRDGFVRELSKFYGTQV